jgi:hypothetical protein
MRGERGGKRTGHYHGHRRRHHQTS